MNYKNIYMQWLNAPNIDEIAKKELINIKDNEDEIKEVTHFI